MNPEDYVSYPLALALKKAGFDYPCYFYYTRKDSPDDHVYSTTSEEAPIDYNRSVYAGCSMPTLAQAQKWLREVKRIEVNASWESIKRYWFFYTNLMDVPDIVNLEDISDSVYSTYEQALSAGIAAALELIEKKGE